MKIGTIRRVVNDHENSFLAAIKDFFFSYDSRFFIKGFLNHLQQKPNQEELSTPELVDLIRIILSTKDEILTVSIKAEFNEPLISLISKLEALGDGIDGNDLKILFNLKPNQFEYFNAVVAKLQQHDLFTHEGFKKLLAYITNKLPDPAESTVIKTSKKTTSKLLSELTIDNKIKILLEHDPNKEYHEGGIGKVKMGYAVENPKSILFGIKKLKLTIPNKNKYAKLSPRKKLNYEEKLKIQQLNENLNDAKREVKYRRLLGDEAFYYQHKNNVYIAADWIKGVDLGRFTELYPDSITSESLQNRLCWVITALSDLNILHSNYRIHSDIKPNNLVLDVATATLRLIDLGSAHKIYSRSAYATTHLFHDNAARHDFNSDIYSMGIVIAYIFPELFSLEKTIKAPDHSAKDEKIIVSKLRSPQNLIEQAIGFLVAAMLDDRRNKRCTCKEALTYVEAIHTHYAELNNELLGEIRLTTIDKQHNEVEDMLHAVHHRHKAKASF